MTAKKDPKDFLPMGRPTMYKPEFCQEMIDYFTVEHTRTVLRFNEKTKTEYEVDVPNKLPTLAGFAGKIGVSRGTLKKWAEAHPDFLSATTRAKALAEDMVVNNTLLGHYQSNFAIFVAKNYTDMRDVKDLNVNDGREEPPQSTNELMEAINRRLERIAELQDQTEEAGED